MHLLFTSFRILLETFANSLSSPQTSVRALEDQVAALKAFVQSELSAVPKVGWPLSYVFTQPMFHQAQLHTRNVKSARAVP
jgi:hypothetical protein